MFLNKYISLYSDINMVKRSLEDRFKIRKYGIRTPLATKGFNIAKYAIYGLTCLFSYLAWNMGVYEGVIPAIPILAGIKRRDITFKKRYLLKKQPKSKLKVKQNIVNQATIDDSVSKPSEWNEGNWGVVATASGWDYKKLTAEEQQANLDLYDVFNRT